jgi:hypothetical protein
VKPDAACRVWTTALVAAVSRNAITHASNAPRPGPSRITSSRPRYPDTITNGTLAAAGQANHVASASATTGPASTTNGAPRATAAATISTTSTDSRSPPERRRSSTSGPVTWQIPPTTTAGTPRTLPHRHPVTRPTSIPTPMRKDPASPTYISW